MKLMENIQSLFTADRDPSVNFHGDREAELSTAAYAANSKKAFFWQQIAQFSLMGLAAVVGGMAAVGITPVMGAVAGVCGVVGLGASVVAHSINVDNEINVEELYSKRTGVFVAEKLRDVTLNVQQRPAQNLHHAESAVVRDVHHEGRVGGPQLSTAHSL